MGSPVVIVNQEEVRELLPMQECIGVMEQALRSLASGQAILPLRMAMRLPQDNILGIMPAYLGDLRSVGAKIITVFPKNHGTEYEPHQGVVMLFETEHGSLQAIVDGTAITGIRTAAVSAVATKVLAKPDAGDLAILGAGTQARAHLEAMMLVRKLKRVRVWSILAEEARLFSKRESKHLAIGIEAAPTAREAVAGADLICTVTPAREPILLGEWLAKGAHINAVGSCLPHTRELDTGAVKSAKVYADRRESVLSEAGDFIIPRNEGAITDSHLLGEIGDVLLGKVEGRSSAGEITLFKSLGLAIEDLAAALHVCNQAREKGLGQQVAIGGRRFSK